MFDLLYDHEQVAIDSAVHRRVAFALDGKGHAVGHACMYIERNHLLLVLHSGAVAVGAVFFDDLAIAVTLRTHCGALAESENGLLSAHYRAGSMTCGAGDERRAVFGSGAIAMVTFCKGF